ncbi:P52K-like protein [Mya arenaria]|uniref:P52K-like protein n=2 Tax=Mya arenaria TaxID=6604 RepID=A0ABY7FPT1_MYAAR|nr:P52K-like protein [Mya arenaria]
MPHGSRPQPVQTADEINTDRWFTEIDVKCEQARIEDTVWLLTRQTDTEEQKVPAWRAFNESTSQASPPMTTIGMLPILQAPADDFDTLTTVIDRFIAISNHVGQTHTVITGDQPLYAKGIELTWANQEKYKNVIFRLGGLHVCFNFLKAIGQHMESAGLDDVWVDAGVYPPNVTSNMMEGKAYYRAVRAHILTYEALWRLRWTMFRSWLHQKAGGTSTDVGEMEASSTDLVNIFKTSKITGYDQNVMDQAAKLHEVILDVKLIGQMQEFDSLFFGNKQYVFWKTYMDMIEILLLFIRAEREGNWKLHLEAFAAMLPWLTAYDHLNYARWGPVYLAEMKDLENRAPEVYTEFMNGNFVVKRSNNHFSQIPTDQATEWINKLCKLNNGIIGITRNDSARDKFCITWAFRSNISQKMRALYTDTSGDDEDEFTSTRADFQRSRVDLDESHVQALLQYLDIRDVFCCKGLDLLTEVDIETDNADNNLVLPVRECSKLVSIATKDVATTEITKNLVEARDQGAARVLQNAHERLVSKKKQFFDPMKKMKLKTFATLYQVPVKAKQTTQIIKADRRLMQRLFNAANAGRTVEIASVLKHELSPVPLSLAKVGGIMNPTAKSDLLAVLTTDSAVFVQEELPVATLKTAIVIDGHAMIQALGKPDGCVTFGEYADVFVQCVLRYFNTTTHRIDVAFDRYIGKSSIKASARSKRSGNRRPIRRMITGPDVPLPQSLDTFLAMDENKADIARFLSENLATRADSLPRDQELVTGGGYQNVLKATSNRREVPQLSSNQEEADTRIIIHALDAVREDGYLDETWRGFFFYLVNKVSDPENLSYLYPAASATQESMLALLDFYRDDMPQPDMFVQEVQLWKQTWRNTENKPSTIVETLTETCQHMYPNISKVLTLLLLTSVTSAGVERSNSSWKFIKNPHRSTMGQSRFNALMLLFIHRDIKLDIEEIVNIYARKYPRRMLLIDPLCE